MPFLSFEYKWFGPRGRAGDDRSDPGREVRSGRERHTAMGGEYASGLVTRLDNLPRCRGEYYPTALVGETRVECRNEPIALCDTSQVAMRNYQVRPNEIQEQPIVRVEITSGPIECNPDHKGGSVGKGDGCLVFGPGISEEVRVEVSAVK
jgi:hypothetical protein